MMKFLVVFIVLVMPIAESTSPDTESTNSNASQARSNNVLLVPNMVVPSPRELSSFLQTLKDLQLGMDFKMPFLNIPYPSIFSGLWSGTGSTGLTTSSLLSLNLVSVALFSALMFLAYFVYPVFFGNMGWWPGITGYRNFDEFGQGVEQMVGTVNRALERFEIDSDACVKMALCTLGKARQSDHQARGKGTTTVQILDGVLNLSMVDEKLSLSKRGYRQARDYGESGGDCGTFNRQRKCPLDTDTWNLLLSSVNSSI